MNKITGNSKFLLVFIIALVLFSKITTAQVYFNNLEGDSGPGNWTGLQTIQNGNAFSGEFMAVTNPEILYGLGIEQQIPTDYVLKNVILKVSGYVKTNILPNNSVYTVTLVNNNKTILWKGIPLKPLLSDTLNWHAFADSIIIPARDTKNTIIKTYLWNRDNNASTYIDDLRFELIPFETPTHLPLLPDVTPVSSHKKSKILFSNNYFTVSHDGTKITFLGKTGDTIIEDISYYSEKSVKDEIYKEHNNWNHKKTRKIDNGKELVFKCTVKKSSLKLTIKCLDNSPTATFIIEEKYSARQEVFRESVVVNYKNKISEIYRNNRTVDSEEFLNEYWLDQQGIKSGDGENSMFIYNTPEISSQQICILKNLLFLNLDYYEDHPFFRFPLDPDSVDWKLDESQSYYSKKEKRNYSFDITLGTKTKTIPRIQKNPNGFEATYVWTEHADYTDIRTNRATYFGSEKITDADSATGGFVFYNIPVTKSVFYANPDSITNFEASNGDFTSLEIAITCDTLYEDFLFQIQDKGHDICLHTPEHFTTTQERFEEALFFMQINFGSPSWIDHGNNNGPQNNREDLICDATIENSPFYAIDLWKKYGVKYLHNAYYEEMLTYDKWQFEPSIEKPYSGYGDFFPKKDYYRFPSKTKDLIHWPTTNVLFIDQPNLWNYYFNKEKLHNIITNRQVIFNHVYPAWVDPQKGIWTYDNDSVIIAQPGFNKALSTLETLRDEGSLNVTTIADYLDFRTSVDKVKYEILPDGRIRVTNNSNRKINGLSFAVKSHFVTVNGIVPDNKTSGNDLIFWFDINPGESKIIRII